MLDLVKSVRFPTLAEVITLHEVCSPSKDGYIMCTVGEKPCHATKVMGCLNDTIELNPQLTTAEIMFYPVFELHPEFASSIKCYTSLRIAQLWKRTWRDDTVYEWTEPTVSTGFQGIVIAPGVIMTTEPVITFATWKGASGTCMDLPQWDYVFCPHCTALHHVEYGDSTRLVMKCSNCGDDFVASRVNRVGTAIKDYVFSGDGIESPYCTSTGVLVPMRNGKSSSTLVDGWPASLFNLTLEDFCEAYATDTTVKTVIDRKCGDGWGRIDKVKLRAAAQTAWPDIDVNEFNKFILR